MANLLKLSLKSLKEHKELSVKALKTLFRVEFIGIRSFEFSSESNPVKFGILSSLQRRTQWNVIIKYLFMLSTNIRTITTWALWSRTVILVSTFTRLFFFILFQVDKISIILIRSNEDSINKLHLLISKRPKIDQNHRRIQLEMSP